MSVGGPRQDHRGSSVAASIVAARASGEVGSSGDHEGVHLRTTPTAPTAGPIATGHETDDRIRETLNAIHDPCSLAANAPIGLVDMGLVVGWEVDDDHRLRVALTVTAPGCMLAPKFALDAELQLRALDLFSDVEITFERGGFWTEDRIAPAARARLAERRTNANHQLGVTPQAWKRSLPMSSVPSDPSPTA